MALPEPRLGLVISYSYLWAHEYREGRDEGAKDRPCVIILAVERAEFGAKAVTVAPITHTLPDEDTTAIEIPAAVKKSIGLDDAPSWVIVDEANEFVWPGFDLRPIPETPRRYDYGFLPPRLFQRIAEAVAQNWSKGAGKRIPR